MSEPAGGVEHWVFQHFGVLLGGFAVIVIGLAGLMGWLIVDELQQGEKLAGIKKAGPCRAVGITDPECQKQARRIFAACYVQREECREKYGLILVHVRNRRQLPENSNEVQNLELGGDALQSPSQGGQQPAPGKPGDGAESPGKGGEPAPRDEGKPAPANPPPPQSPPPDNSTLDEVGDKVDEVLCTLPIDLCP